MVMHRVRTDPGWVKRELRDIRRDLAGLRSEKRLRSSSFADVPDGAIPTSKLAAPTAPGYVSLTATGFAVTTTAAAVIDTTVTVPAGFRSCVVSLTGRVYAANSTGSAAALYGQVEVNGVTGNAMPVTVAAGAAGLDVGTLAAVLNDLLPASTFTVRLTVRATSGWAADDSNTADLAGTLSWFS